MAITSSARATAMPAVSGYRRSGGPEIEKLRSHARRGGELGDSLERRGFAARLSVIRRAVLARAFVNDDLRVGRAGRSPCRLDGVGHVADGIDEPVRERLWGGVDPAVRQGPCRIGGNSATFRDLSDEL